MTSDKSPKGGRPSKTVGPNVVKVHLRLALQDHAELAELAKEINMPGRPLPTVQDVIRWLVRGSLTERETLRRLVDVGHI